MTALALSHLVLAIQPAIDNDTKLALLWIHRVGFGQIIAKDTGVDKRRPYVTGTKHLATTN